VIFLCKIEEIDDLEKERMDSLSTAHSLISANPAPISTSKHSFFIEEGIQSSTSFLSIQYKISKRREMKVIRDRSFSSSSESDEIERKEEEEEKKRKRRRRRRLRGMRW